MIIVSICFPNISKKLRAELKRVVANPIRMKKKFQVFIMPNIQIYNLVLFFIFKFLHPLR